MLGRLCGVLAGRLSPGRVPVGPRAFGTAVRLAPRFDAVARREPLLPVPSGADTPLKCTIFDKRGRVTAVAANLDRKRFLKEEGLHSRDLRHLDGPQRSLVPYIQVQRGHNMLVNICDLRVLIKSDEVFVFHSRDPAIAERLSMLMYDLTAKLGRRSPRQGRLQHTGQDYEQVALEVVLIHAMSFLEVELNLILQGASRLLTNLDHDLSYVQFRDLLYYSKELKLYFRRSMAVRKALDDALDDSSGLMDMYLTDSSRGENPTDYNDIEILLETYYSQADEFVQKAGQTMREIGMTEEIMAIVIDANRNALILFRLELSVLTIGLAFGTFLADLYGMNLENFIEEDAWGMPVVSAVIAALAVAGTVFNFKRVAITKRVFMPQANTPRPGRREALKSWLREAHDRPNNLS